jgi:hypothetical protein
MDRHGIGTDDGRDRCADASPQTGHTGQKMFSDEFFNPFRFRRNRLTEFRCARQWARSSGETRGEPVATVRAAVLENRGPRSRAGYQWIMICKLWQYMLL